MLGPEKDDLLERWRRGDRDDTGLYRLVREAMIRAAWRGIQRMIGQRPNDDDIEEVVFKAFEELLRADPKAITSLVGRAYTTAYRRGQDRGRWINKRREFPDSPYLETERDDEVLPNPDAAVIEEEEAAERERLLAWMRQCLETLPESQAEVVQDTILRQRDISSWAHEKGKTYQAADQQRGRALNALKRCIESHRVAEGGDHVV